MDVLLASSLDAGSEEENEPGPGTSGKLSMGMYGDMDQGAEGSSSMEQGFRGTHEKQERGAR